MSATHANNKRHEHRLKKSRKTARNEVMSLAESLAQRANGLAHQAVDAVSQGSQRAAQIVGEGSDRAAQVVGSQLHVAAEQVRDRMPENGILHSAGERLATSLEQSGQYLENQKLSGAMDDMKHLIKKYPIPSVLIAAGLGLAFARMTSRRRP